MGGGQDAGSEPPPPPLPLGNTATTLFGCGPGEGTAKGWSSAPSSAEVCRNLVVASSLRCTFFPPRPPGIVKGKVEALDRVSAQLEDREKEVGDLQGSMKALEAENAQLRAEVEDMMFKEQELAAKGETSGAAVSQLQATVQARDNQLKLLEAKLHEVEVCGSPGARHAPCCAATASAWSWCFFVVLVLVPCAGTDAWACWDAGVFGVLDVCWACEWYSCWCWCCWCWCQCWCWLLLLVQVLLLVLYRG